MDPAERMFFGGGDDNLIYQVYLYRKQEDKGYSVTNSSEKIIAIGGVTSVEDVFEDSTSTFGTTSTDNKKGNLFKGHVLVFNRKFSFLNFS